MKPFVWSPEKNEQLMAERTLCFEAVVVAIEAGALLDVLEHPNPARYRGNGSWRSGSTAISTWCPMWNQTITCC